MKKTITTLFVIIIAIQCFSLSYDYYKEIDPKLEKQWICTVNSLLKNYYPFRTEIIGHDFDKIKAENNSLPKTLESFFLLGTDYQQELSKDPNIKNVEYKAEFYVSGDISSFELQAAHTNLNCFELFELVATETTNTFCFGYDPTRGKIKYEIKKSEPVN